MFPTTIPQPQLNLASESPFLAREYLPGPQHLSPEHWTIVSELERVSALGEKWRKVTPSEGNIDIFSEGEDLQYEPMPIEYSHTIEVIRNFVGIIPPQEYSLDDDG
jgi:hypothetical protein